MKNYIRDITSPPAPEQSDEGEKERKKETKAKK